MEKLNRNRFKRLSVTIDYFTKTKKNPVAAGRLLIIHVNTINATTRNISSKMMVFFLILLVIRHYIDSFIPF